MHLYSPVPRDEMLETREMGTGLALAELDDATAGAGMHQRTKPSFFLVLLSAAHTYITYTATQCILPA